MTVAPTPVEPIEDRGLPLHLADPSVPAEAALATAHHRSRTMAFDMLSTWFPALDIERMTQTTDAATFSIGPTASNLLRSPLLAPGFLDRLLADRGFRPADARLVRDREHLPPGTALTPPNAHGRSALDVTAIGAYLLDGFTVVFDGIDLRHEASMRLAEMVERAFGAPVNINGYLSLRPHTSFGAHWDDQEVIIVQLLGSKRWTVEEPTALSPSKAAHPDQTSGRVVWDGELHVGQALYVPRGWGHRVQGNDTLSFHYTITIPRLNGVDVLRTLLGAPTGQLPRLDAAPGHAADAVARWLAGQTAETMIAAAQAAHRAGIVDRSTQRLRADPVGARLGPATWVRCPVSSGWVIAGPSTDAVTVLVGGRPLRLSPDACDHLARHGDGVARSVDNDDDPSVLRALQAHGLLDLGEGDPGWGVARRR